METEASEISDRTERLSLITGHNALCRVLDHLQMMSPRDFHDRIHLTGNACIMNRHDRLRPFGNRFLDQRLIQIHRIRAYIHKYSLRPSEYKRICRRHKRIGRHNHLIPLANLGQQRAHLGRVGTGCRQHHFRRSRHFLQPLAAFFRKRPVPTKLSALYSLSDIFCLIPCDRRYIKMNHPLKTSVSSFYNQNQFLYT